MALDYKIYHELPEGIPEGIKSAGCYCEYEGKILLLKRQPDRSEGNTWGVPGGKFEKGEDARAAVIREVYEEVGLKIGGDDLVEFGKLHVCFASHVNYLFYMFKKTLKEFPAIQLDLKEHQEARWLTFNEALMLPLISGGAEALHCYKKVASNIVE